MTEPRVGDVVQQAAKDTTRPWVRLALAQLVLTGLGFVIVGGLVWWVVDYLDSAKVRDEAIADIVAAFADLATADTPAEQQAARERIDEARKRLPVDNPVRRQLEDNPPSSLRPDDRGAPEQTAAPTTTGRPPMSRGPVATSSSTTGPRDTTSTTAPLLTVDPPALGPIDLPPVTVPCTLICPGIVA